MLRLAVRVTSLVLALACLVAAQGQNSQLSERYEDKEKGYVVRYPAAYEMQGGADASTTIFASPEDGQLDIFRENLAVLVRGYERDVAVAEARAALKKEMEAQGAKQTESDDRATLAGRDAHRYVWSMRLGGFDLILVQLVTSVKERVYVVTYTFEKGSEHRHRATADAMVRAFEITYK